MSDSTRGKWTIILGCSEKGSKPFSLKNGCIGDYEFI